MFKRYVSKYQEFQNISKEILKLLLNIPIVLFSNKIQLLLKQQLVNYLVQKLNNNRHLRLTAEFFSYILRHLSKKWEIYTFL